MEGKNWWVPGEMHAASITTPYLWDATVAGQKYLYKPDVKIDGAIMPSDGNIRPSTPRHTLRQLRTRG
ncbi:hypothetical protein [Streptomyces sp. NPDC002785]|uniref:hypothetical protein n=1 Tax=Streptomyces sp. NPDC002785 TaxID=3154543 RepID=UPI0033211B69